MSSHDQSTPSKGARITGHIMSGFVVFALIFSALTKLMATQMVVESFAQQGWPAGSAMTIGLIELVVGIVYAIPRLSVLGAILVTGYFGGAVCLSLRFEPAGAIVALVIGVLAWGGLYIRDPRIRVLIPLKRG
jgi:small-conductance mechanosensitive channel